MVLRPKNAIVVVLGDIGRSPRMCYHAKSLADQNYHVQIVGYIDTLPHPLITNHPNIRLKALRSTPKLFNDLNQMFSLILKFIWTFFTLLMALFFQTHWPLLILLQNPPGIPSMLICWLCARLKRAQFIIDWHNYTYSILSDRHGMHDLRLNRHVKQAQNPLEVRAAQTSGTGDAKSRRLAKGECYAKTSSTVFKKRSTEKKKKVSGLQRMIERAYYWEGFFGRYADLNLCVTHAMRDDMFASWGIQSAILYDRPPSWKFRSLDADEKHEFFYSLANNSDSFKSFLPNTTSGDENFSEVTRFSYKDGSGAAVLRSDRPLLLLSSTSWTEDEDFSMLLDALREYDVIACLSFNPSAKTRLPQIVCTITGKGPLKEYYASKIDHMNLKNVQIIMPWLEASDYPRLIGAADIGVSLHTSTSGLDLPMKIVDMFGCRLPVIAKRFACIEELVNDGFNGRLFDNSHDLLSILKLLACGFPDHSTLLHSLRKNISDDAFISWEKNWEACVWPLLAAYGSTPSEEAARRKRFSILTPHEE